MQKPAFVLATISIYSGLAYAQSRSIFRSGSIEAGAFVGQAVNLDQRPAIYGGNVTFALNRRMLPYAEYTRFSGIQFRADRRIPGLTSPITIQYRTPYTDVHGGVHIRLPIRESRLVPYLAAGLGALAAPTRLFNVNVEGIQIPFTASASRLLAFNSGGGIRYYASQRFGVRAEAKYYRSISTSSVSPATGSSNFASRYHIAFGKYEFGVFYQFR